MGPRRPDCQHNRRDRSATPTRKPEACESRAPCPPRRIFRSTCRSSGAIPIRRSRAMRREAPIAFVPQLGSTLLTRRDDIFVSEKRIDVFSLAPARRPDDQADGPQHDAQGRRGAHGGALDLLSRRVAEGGARALARRIPGACGSHSRWARAGRAAPTCWRSSRCRSRASASSRSPASPTSATRTWMPGRRA